MDTGHIDKNCSTNNPQNTPQGDELTLSELESLFVILQSVLANIIYSNYHPTRMEEYKQTEVLLYKLGRLIAKRSK